MPISRWLAVGFWLALSGAQAAPFEGSDPKVGQTLESKHCTACHSSMKGGDGSKIYSRADHKMKTPAQLAAQISRCADAAGAKWFPEDEAHVAAYLNLKHYHFK